MNRRHYEKVRSVIGDKARLCIVTKHRTKEQILSYYEEGERIFAENRAQELLTKVDLPKDIRWHFIGHLQKNKVRQIVPYVDCIQSVDSGELAVLIDKECARIGRTMDILCEFHLALCDTNKSGHSKEEALPFVKACTELEHLRVRGIMVMGPHTEDTDEIRRVFLEARDLYRTLQSEFPQMDTLSMGMSDDYEIAVQCGSNMVRIGTYLFTEEGD